MSFPNDLLDIRIEAALGADLTQDPSDWEWTDLDSLGDEGRLLSQTLQIRRGRANESSRTQPSTVSFVLDNPDGWLTPGNVVSPLYGKWERGTPVRVTAEGLVRFTGQVAEIAPEWPYGDIERGDYPGESRVRVTAAGVLRRLGQGRRPELSALRRFIEAQRPDAYWPMEGAATAGLTLRGFNYSDGPAGSGPLPEAVETARWTAVTNVDSTLSNRWSVRLLARDLGSMVVETAGGAFSTWMITRVSGSLVVGLLGDGGSQVVVPVPAPPAGVWVEMLLTVWKTGTSFLEWSLSWTPLDGSPGAVGTDLLLGDLRTGNVQRVYGTGPEGSAFGHLAISAALLPSAVAAANGWRGETAGDRLTRMGVVVQGDAATPLGVEPIAPPAEVIADAVTADGGFLIEDGMDLLARARNDLVNQTPVLVLDAGANEIANPFEPVLDDQRLRNDVTVKSDGFEARVTDEESLDRLGQFEESTPLNLAWGWQASQHAGWRLHLGTWEGMRYPSVTVDLAIAPHLINDVTAVREGDRIQVVNLPSQHPAGTVDLLVEGIAETLSPSEWTVEFACSPAGPWTVGVVEDDVLGRADTAGCVLADDVDTEETTWELTTTVGPEWITTSSHPDEFPFDLEVGGEVVTVTAITGTSPQTATVIRSVNGISKSHAAGAPVRLANPAVAAL